MYREFSENREGVHLMVGEYTLCGDAFDIDALDESDHDGAPVATQKKTITCKRCASIIMLCRGLKINLEPK